MKTALRYLILAAFTADLARAVAVFLGASTLPANVLQGCSPATVAAPLAYGADGSAPDPSWANRIVLFDRTPTGLSFAAKIDAAIGRGAVGVIIADSGPSPAGGFAGQLLPAGTFRPLPAFLVTQADGATLRAAAGSVVAIGTVAPAPDPAGHSGEALISDGSRLLFAKIVAISGTAAGTAKVGTALALLASSDGDKPLSFQWSKDGTPIAGATSNLLAIPSVAAGDAGSYACTTSNLGGSATSDPFVLTVPAP